MKVLVKVHIFANAKICPHFDKCVADDYSQIVATYTFMIDGTSNAGPLQIQDCYLVKHMEIP